MKERYLLSKCFKFEEEGEFWEKGIADVKVGRRERMNE